MEQVVDMLKQNEEQVRVEKDMVIENLNKEIESLRKRQEQTMNEQLKFLEEENKKLVKVSYLSALFYTSNYQNEWLNFNRFIIIFKISRRIKLCLKHG